MVKTLHKISWRRDNLLPWLATVIIQMPIFWQRFHVSIFVIFHADPKTFSQMGRSKLTISPLYFWVLKVPMKGLNKTSQELLMLFHVMLGGYFVVSLFLCFCVFCEHTVSVHCCTCPRPVEIIPKTKSSLKLCMLSQLFQNRPRF